MHTARTHDHQGFTLVEMLVGMVMGLLVVLVIMQAFSVAEGYKRTTTTGADAQTNGLMALRTLESELRMAGYGMTNNANLCPSINSLNPTNQTVTTTTGMPVKIADGGNGSDTIEVVYSSSVVGGAPTRIKTDMPVPANVTKVSNLAGINVCDFVLYASPTGGKTCTMLQVTGLQPNNVQFQTGSGQSNYNPPGGFNGSLFPAGGYTTSDIVINMGSFVDKRFSVNKNGTNDEYYFRQTNLMSANNGCSGQDPNPNLDMISNIVNIQAQYGVAPVNSQEVNCWTSAATTDTGCSISSGNWSNPPAADVKRIKAIRVAVVARSALSERPSTGNSCNTTSSAPNSWDGGPAINLTSISNWQCYRYKVYQSVIPLLNIIWANT